MSGHHRLNHLFLIFLEKWVNLLFKFKSVDRNSTILGEAVYLNSMEDVANDRFNEHEFNVVVSEMISKSRSLPDVRDPK